MNNNNPEKNQHTVPLNDRFELVSEVYDCGETAPEIVTFIREKSSGIVWQDIACVRPADGKAEVLVWNNENYEDYSHKFTIDIHKEDEK